MSLVHSLARKTGGAGSSAWSQGAKAEGGRGEAEGCTGATWSVTVQDIRTGRGWPALASVPPFVPFVR